jgi:hypothetical protein
MTQAKTICTIEGCETPAIAKGLCAKHYMRGRRHGDVNQVKPRGAPKNAWKAHVRGMIDPAEMSPRSFNRYFATLVKQVRYNFNGRAFQAVADEATRPNGSFNVSKFAAFTDFLIRHIEERRRKRWAEVKALRRGKRKQAQQ